MDDDNKIKTLNLVTRIQLKWTELSHLHLYGLYYHINQPMILNSFFKSQVTTSWVFVKVMSGHKKCHLVCFKKETPSLFGNHTPHSTF